jgi:very-short-patch-repair endonuclease
MSPFSRRPRPDSAGFEIDFCWPEERVAVEIDGFAFHRTQQRFEDDHRRDAALRRDGITVIRITWRGLTREPWAVIADVAQALALTAR